MVVLLAIVERHSLFQMRSGRGHLTEEVYCDPQRMVGYQQESQVLDTLGQAETLLGQLARRLVLCSHQVKPPQSPEDREEIRGLPHLLA